MLVAQHGQRRVDMGWVGVNDVRLQVHLYKVKLHAHTRWKIGVLGGEGVG